MAQASEIMGETGRVTGLTHAPRTVQLSRSYEDPVVFALTPSANGGQPAAVRISHVQADRFTLQLQEPNYLDGRHIGEAVSYIVLEAGRWRLDGGALLEVGAVEVDGLTGRGFEPVAFGHAFAAAPAVLSQVQTFNGLDFVRTRHDGIGPDGFALALEEEEARNGGGHLTEEVGYLALSAGSGEWGGHAYQAGTTAAAVTDAWTALAFAPDVGGDGGAAPQFLAALASFNGADPAGLRYRGLDGGGVEIRVEEERSADAETAHVAEQIAFLALAGEGPLTARPFAGPQDYAEVIRPLAPVVYWRLGEEAGDDTADDSAGNADAAYAGGIGLGAPGLVPGAGDDAAARFDGLDDRLVLDPAPDEGEPVDILVLGDSLADPDFSWIDPADAFPAGLEAALTRRGYGVDVIDAAVGGDDTAKGLARLEALLADGPPPDAAIVELGTNDALNRFDIAAAEDNLRDILRLLDDSGVEVLLAGAHGAYPGAQSGFTDPDRAAAFEAIYPALAEEFGVDLYPRFLDGVLDDPDRYAFGDMLHPNAAGVDLIVDRMLPQVMGLVESTGLVDDPLRLAEGTVALWFQPDDLDGIQGLVSKAGTPGKVPGHFVLHLQDGGGVRLAVEDGAEVFELTAPGPGAVRPGVPNQAAFTFGPEGAALYVNGALVDDAPGYAGGLSGSVEPTVVGALDWRSDAGEAGPFTDFFAGIIDEVTVFDRALAAETVGALYAAGIGGAGDDLDTLVAGAGTGAVPVPVPVA